MWRENGSHSIGVNDSGVLSVYGDNYPFATINLKHQTVIPLNTWTHIAVVKSANIIRAYVNGVQSTESASEVDVLNNSSGSVISIPASMRVDDYRITKGVARYSGGFTPPSAAFPTS